MITIVIADDEKLIRAGIAKIIRESIDVPLEILEAKNGQEALDLCKSERPNVLVTDIRMPIMDGVELMKNISQLEIKPTLIVLSGYDDFVYAKAAIQSGAMSYILKPVDKKELVSAVQKAISDYRNNEQKRNEETLKSIIEEGRVNSTDGMDGWNFPNGFSCVCAIGSHCKKLLSAALTSIEYYSLESKKDYELIVIPREATYILGNNISLNSLILGISNPAQNLSMLRTVKKQAFIAAMEAFFDEHNVEISEKKHGVYYYKTEENQDFQRVDELYEQILTKLIIASPNDIQSGVEKLFDFTQYDEDNGMILDYLYSKICSNLFTRYPVYSQDDDYLHLKSIMIENIWQFKNVKEWKTCVQDYLIYLSELLKKDNSEYPFIEEALDYIKANFNKNINMAMVANQVSVNYTWFSEKFKEHTGVNFNDYMKRLRIEEACRLLEKGCYKVYEVCEKCGFGDVKYFMKVFKEATGVTPGEWKNLHNS